MFRFVVLILCVAVPALTTPVVPVVKNEPIVSDDVVGYQLPRTTIPIQYQVALTTNIHLAEFDFSGSVIIDLVAMESTESIVLHHRQLTIGDITLTHNGDPIDLLPSTYDPLREFLSINTDGVELVEGNMYQLTIQFTGTLRGAGNDYGGFYRSYYTDAETNERRYLATTQFEATDARHAFPCYDEPGMKARFEISITHGAEYAAVSNMPVAAISGDDGGMVTTIFEYTPYMSTYLIAFVISDFAYLETDVGNIPHRVYLEPSLIQDSDFAVEASVRILENLEEHLGVPFTLPKMDQFGIPHFSAGAMENWGLVTYRPQYLYWNNLSSRTQKRAITTIVAHEYAHQWFGNLVSPEWWTYLWLNEGFATLFEHWSTDREYPEYRTMEMMVTHSVQYAFSPDASATIRPMSHPAYSPNEIDRLFDSVAYDKSGSVLRMMMFAFGEEDFINGLNIYLNDRQLNVANGEDLFDNLQIALGSSLPDGITFNDIMRTWSLQPGYPYINVDYNAADGAFIISQTRYLSASLVDEGEKWYIPLTYVSESEAEADTNNGTTAEFWMPPSDTDTVWTIPAGRNTLVDGEWYLFNKNLTGYYRVNYPLGNWYSLIDELQFNPDTKIPLLNRAQLLDDSMNLARSNRLTFDIPMAMLEYLVHEEDYFPWYVAYNNILYFNRTLAGTEEYDEFMATVRHVIEPTLTKLGVIEYDFDELYVVLTRRLLITLSCMSGHDLCATASRFKLNEDTGTVQLYPRNEELRFVDATSNVDAVTKSFKRVFSTKVSK